MCFKNYLNYYYKVPIVDYYTLIQSIPYSLILLSITDFKPSKNNRSKERQSYYIQGQGPSSDSRAQSEWHPSQAPKPEILDNIIEELDNEDDVYTDDKLLEEQEVVGTS